MRSNGCTGCFPHLRFLRESSQLAKPQTASLFTPEIFKGKKQKRSTFSFFFFLIKRGKTCMKLIWLKYKILKRHILQLQWIKWKIQIQFGIPCIYNIRRYRLDFSFHSEILLLFRLFSYLSYRNPRIVEFADAPKFHTYGMRYKVEKKFSKRRINLIAGRRWSKLEAWKVSNWHDSQSDIKRRYDDRRVISIFDRRLCNYWISSKFNSQIGLPLEKRQYCNWDYIHEIFNVRKIQ